MMRANILPAVLALALMCSCTDEEETPEQSTKSTLTEVEEKFAEAADEAQDLTSDLAGELRSRVDQLETMIADLKSKSESVSEPETKAVLTRSADELESKRAALAAKLEAVEDAEKEAWDALRVELDQALLEFKRAYDRALKDAGEQGSP